MFPGGGPGAPDAGGTAHTRTGSPAVSEAAEQHGLVNLATFEPSILIDLRYAGGANVAGAPPAGGMDASAAPPDLGGKVAVVTGASRGIGRCIALELADMSEMLKISSCETSVEIRL